MAGMVASAAELVVFEAAFAASVAGLVVSEAAFVASVVASVRYFVTVFVMPESVR